MNDTASPEARHGGGPAVVEEELVVPELWGVVEDPDVDGLLLTVAVLVTVATGPPVVALELPQAATPSTVSTGSARRRTLICMVFGLGNAGSFVRAASDARPDERRGERARICM